MKNISSKHAFLAVSILLTCGLPHATQAAVLASYDFTTAAPFVSGDSEPNATASNFTFASGLSANSGRSTTAPNTNTIFTRGNSLSTDEATALSGNDYYTFTLTPLTGYEIDLTSLTFFTDATVAGALVFTSNIFIRSSLDGFASNIGATITDIGSATSGYVQQTVDLSAFQNISLSTAPTGVEFRIYLYNTGADATNTNSILRSDTYILNGSVAAVPEPATYPLLGLSSFALWSLRRRRS